MSGQLTGAVLSRLADALASAGDNEDALAPTVDRQLEVRHRRVRDPGERGDQTTRAINRGLGVEDQLDIALERDQQRRQRLDLLALGVGSNALDEEDLAAQRMWQQRRNRGDLADDC